MNIPLKIIQAGLTEEYVAAVERIKKLNKTNSELYKKGTEVQEKARTLWVQDAGRNYSVKHPTSMEWREVVAIHDLSKEFLEINGMYQEYQKEMAEAQDDLTALHVLAKMEWSGYSWE